jgi:hypothetical protein
MTNKHTTTEIMAAHATGSTTSIEAGALAVYELGFGAGQEEVKVRMLANDAQLRTEIDARQRATPAAPEAHPAETEYNRDAARRRELHDKDRDTGQAQGSGQAQGLGKPQVSGQAQAKPLPHR